MEHIRQIGSTKEVNKLKLKYIHNHFKPKRIKCYIQKYEDCQVSTRTKTSKMKFNCMSFRKDI